MNLRNIKLKAAVIPGQGELGIECISFIMIVIVGHAHEVGDNLF